MKRNRKIATILLAALLCLTMTLPALGEGVAFPLAETLEVTYWAPMRSNVARSISTFAEAELYTYLEEMTNIHLTFTHPTLGEEDTAFNLLLARTPLPDVIEYDYGGYTGGASQALADGIIMDVSDLIPVYMPNFNKYLESMPELRQKFGTPDGAYGYFPFIRDPEVSLVNAGMIIRADLLAQTGLSMPTTIDELHDVLVALKENTDVKYPMLISDTALSRSIWNDQGRVFTGAWDIVMTYFQDNGVVKYGPYEPAYKDMMTTLHQWYEEGLLETEFTAINSGTALESGIFGGDWAVFSQNIGPMEKMVSEGQKLNPEFAVTGMPPLTLEAGGSNRMISTMETVPLDNNNYGLAISSTCDPAKVPAILAMIDYGYGEAGSLLYSIGQENVCYTVDEDGNYAFTDLMINNPAGVAKTDYWYRYCRGNDGGAYVLRTTEFANLYWSLPMQVEATAAWTSQMDAYTANPWRLNGVVDTDTASRIAEKQVDIDSYVKEMFVKFLTGTESLDNFDAYLKTLESMGIQSIISDYQTAEDAAK
mgnify:CR=1 FL=1